MPTCGNTFPSSEAPHPFRFGRAKPESIPDQLVFSKEYPTKMFPEVGIWATAKLASNNTPRPMYAIFRMKLSSSRFRNPWRSTKFWMREGGQRITQFGTRIGSQGLEVKVRLQATLEA